RRRGRQGRRWRQRRFQQRQRSRWQRR
ncbi:hypothetical protein, partial [Mycobacterium tuberculosis]